MKERAVLSADEPVLSEADCARLLGVSVETLMQWRRRGEGPPYCRVSKGIVRYLRTRVVQWLDSRLVERTGASDGGAQSEG